MNGRAEVDPRPWFIVAVTGHSQAVEPGPWMWTPDPLRAFAAPGAWPLVSYLDAVLANKTGTHRVCVRCRDCETGVDHLVRAYAKKRTGSYHPIHTERDLYGEEAPYRRDLHLVLRAHALVWYGPREDGPDPVTLAAWMGIPYRVVPAAETTATCDSGGASRGALSMPTIPCR